MSKKEQVQDQGRRSLTASASQRVVTVRRASDNKVLAEFRDGVKVIPR